MSRKICDNIEKCHNPTVVGEDESTMLVYCNECEGEFHIPKDHRGILNNEEYLKIFRRETLQGNQDLFYRYYSQHLKI